ncbi:MAG: hypothetical protein ACKO23_03840, partial [Gemmataceae bacterium]
ADDHIYVARPPLYKVTERKNVRFVQTIEDMTRELIDRGLKGTRLAIYPRSESRVMSSIVCTKRTFFRSVTL